MKKIILSAALLLTLVCCEEFQPVFTGSYDNPDPAKVWTEAEVTQRYGEIITIAALASRYDVGKSWNMNEDFVISGIVSTTDQPGNFYKSFYIQDETGGMEIKAGKNGLYNDFLPGQRVYVICNGLTLGMYGYKSGYGMGMVQIGGSRNIYDDGSYADDYETSYIENSIVIDTHILRGAVEGEVTPYEITVSQLPNAKKQTQEDCKYIGSLVTLKGLRYADEIFCLLYLDSNKDKKSYTNRVFLSDTNGSDTPYGKTHGVTTWAMSESLMTEYLQKGLWDSCKVGSGSSYAKYTDPETGATRDLTLGDLRSDGTYPGVEKAAYSVSQYFNWGGAEIQIRTSGYSKFSDSEIPEEVLDGDATLDVTGVLTLYQGSYQLVVNNISDFVVNGQPLQ